MLKSLIVALLMFVSATAGSVEAASKVILVYGDSLSAGYGIRVEQSWPSLLGDRLKEDTRVGAGGTPSWTVANASISGETTAGGAARIEAVLAEQQPDVVVVELGANDGLRGLPIDLAKQNLARILTAAKTRKAKLLLVGMELPPNYGPDYTAQFRQMYVDLARDHAATLLPFLLAPISNDRSNFLEDNLHPTAAAQPALRDHVLKALKPLLQ